MHTLTHTHVYAHTCVHTHREMYICVCMCVCCMYFMYSVCTTYDNYSTASCEMKNQASNPLAKKQKERKFAEYNGCP